MRPGLNRLMQLMKTLGWREWAALPGLSIPKIKVKVDTGARTSALHTFKLEPYQGETGKRVKFWVHPLQNDTEYAVECDTEVLDERVVTDSGGHVEQRFVIKTPIIVGDQQWPIEVTLTDRDTMKFRMLLGRTAIRNQYLVDASASYTAGKPRLKLNTY